jgi:hypothetical protein
MDLVTLWNMDMTSRILRERCKKGRRKGDPGYKRKEGILAREKMN